ncbi:MAG: sugar ABC transporter permease [Caldilineaceae bacterium]|nr:sugar ABC transporter permease [Caldilineaceae bacterium]
MAVAQANLPVQRQSPGLVGKIVGAKSLLERREALWGYVFLLPWLIGLIIFWIGPILASAYFSLMEYDVLSPPKFIGIENYVRAFTADKQFWPSLWRTLYYSIAVVPLGLLGSLGLAMLLNRKYKGTNIFRTFFFLPHLTPAVALAVLWIWLFHPSVGPINTFLEWAFHIDGPGWLKDKNWAMPALIIISLWAGVGGNSMLIFLAGLQGVPQELLEAAEIDGAGPWTKFRHVTFPMISPTFLFNLILGIIGALKVFTLAFVATNGGPSWATWFYALHIYQQAFAYFRMGYGAALAWIFVVVLLIFTYMQLQISRRWVYYAGD